MNKFKEGDNVVCIDNSHGDGALAITVGYGYTVSHVYGNMIAVAGIINNAFNEERFRLATEADAIQAVEPKPVDMVNNPSHYASGKIECIDAIDVAVDGLSGFEASHTANVLKYCWRWKKKAGVEDLKKARWYLDRLIEKLEAEKA